MFAVGDMAVYPAHGVGVIEAIEHKRLGENTQSFYVMRILDNEMTILIPINTSANVGLRSIISQADVDRVFEILQERDVEISSQTWNRRYRSYMDKIKTGSVFEVASVLRDLYILQSEKDLSYGERKMLDTAKTLLIREISIARKHEQQAVENDIDQLFC